MPPVLDAPNSLEEHPILSPACNERAALPRAQPSSRRERSHVLEWLCRLLTPVPRLRPHRQAYGAPGTPRLETPLDILAREHPDIHLRVLSGIG
jgi:hypothetical protein